MRTAELVIVNWEGQQLTAAYENDKLCELLLDDTKHSILGNIYVGKVKNIVKNINAAFIEFSKGQCGYYSLNENTTHFFMNPKKSQALVPGDELLVQVIREPIKTKPAALTGKLSLTGQHLVLTAKKPFIAMSAKLTSGDETRRLKAIMEDLITEDYGFIVRTQAKNCPESVLVREARQLSRQYEQLLKHAVFLKCFSKVYSGMSACLKYVQNHPDIERITTDIPQVYEELKEELSRLELCVPVVLYMDDSWPLLKLKSLPTQIERALNPRVWLKSGGFLIIQPTEAMVVIDVNTGRYVGKKDEQETFFKTNREAAAEIARQLRLRNLSGIIIIDFIDMKNPAMSQALFKEFGELLAKDSVKSSLVDTTRLGLVEMTRKKERSPLHELLSRRCPQCHGHGFIYNTTNQEGLEKDSE